MAYNPDVPSFDNYGVEDLNKMRENFQILANIATRREDILSLAVETGDILDSRIVEHNLIILSPSNGYYVRWENGLQVCFDEGRITDDGSEYYDITLDYAASFITEPKVGCSASTSLTGPLYRRLAFITINDIKNTSVRFLVKRDSPDVQHSFIDVLYFAIGRWK